MRNYKKRILRIISCALAAGCAFSLFAACKKDKGGEEETPSDGGETKNEQTIPAKTDENGKELLLAKSGKTDYKIVIPQKADTYETFASQELKEFLQKSTGAAFEVISDEGLVYDNADKYISVGDTVLNTFTLASEEYGASGGMVHTDNALVLIAGAEGYGTVNAAYKFMHYEIGWEAYASTEIYYETKETVPLLAFDHYKYIPFSDYRMFLYRNIFGPANLTAATRMGLVTGLWSGGRTLEGRLFASWLHNLPSLVPISDPAVGSDWYSNSNLCLSRQEIADYVTEKVKDLLLLTPDAKYLMLGNGDNTGVCECDSCKEALKTCGTYGGISMLFMNRISEKLENDRFFEEHPQVNADVKMMYLNYHGYVEAPLKENGEAYVKARKNVGSFVCLISACQGHDLDDPDCPINGKQAKNLRAWAKITDTIGVYLYWCNYKDAFTYFNNWAAIQTWGRVFKEVDADYFYAQCIYNDFSPLGDLRQYLMSKYLSDPDCGDFETLVRNFTTHYYKGAEKEMYEFYQATRQHTTLMQQMAGSSCVNCYDNGDIAYANKDWWTLPVIENLLKILDKAYAALENSNYGADKKAEYYKRILIEEATLRYYRYNFHDTTFTASERKQEKEFLTKAFELLGCEYASEYGKIKL